MATNQVGKYTNLNDFQLQITELAKISLSGYNFQRWYIHHIKPF